MEATKPLPDPVSTKITEFKGGFKTIRVETRTWNVLKSLKANENDTFDDVIKELLQQRTKTAGSEDVQLISYGRKTAFFEVHFDKGPIGVEAEYNDVKGNQNEFILDVKIKKIFFGKRIYNASEFFGVDNDHKHYSLIYLNIYFRACALALKKEFRAQLDTRFRLAAEKPGSTDYESIAIWRKLYYDYTLSEDSFSRDIEKPLRLSEQEQPNAHYQQLLKNAPSAAVHWLI